jgi:hypothetical protein
LRKGLFLAIPLMVLWLIAIAAVVLYCLVLGEQHDAADFVATLSDAQVGVTTRDEFMKKTARFKEIESPSSASNCSGENCPAGPGLGLEFENSIFGKFILFPPTIVSVGVNFDSNDIYQGSSVTLDRYGTAYVHMEEEPEAMARAANATPHWSSAEKLHLHLDPAHRHDLTRLRTSCFTSWFGCDTAGGLVSGSSLN